MRSLQQWLDLYAQSHQHPTNKRIHWVAVPGILLTVVALLWWLPTPWQDPSLNWATLAVVPAALFYLRLSRVLGFSMIILLALCLMLVSWASQHLPLLEVALSLFVLLWIAQFIGHHIEGKKPSFFQDLAFLLIGPAWVVHQLLSRLGIRC